MRNKLILALVFILVSLSVVLAMDAIEVRSLDAGKVSPPATISDIAWLAGRWQGEGLGGIAEEVIAPAIDGQMMGMFRHATSEGGIKFYEFYLFAEIDETIVLRIKHFSPDLHGWEQQNDYVEFPLVAIEPNAVYFDGLTYALTGPDTLASAVQIKEQGIATFRFTRSSVAP